MSSSVLSIRCSDSSIRPLDVAYLAVGPDLHNVMESLPGDLLNPCEKYTHLQVGRRGTRIATSSPPHFPRRLR
jgi:hypothetical protein